MGTNTPPLNNKDKTAYLELHLYNELRWLLSAATEWSVQDQLKLDKIGYNVQVYAMDSAFVHARALFEFFLGKTTNNHYGSDAYLNVTLISNSYSNNWKGPLHAFLMHAQDRSQPKAILSGGIDKDLNQMPVDLAWEILELWKQFEVGLDKTKVPGDQKLKNTARRKRKEAIERSACVVNSSVAERHAQEKCQSLRPIFIFS